MSKKLVLSCEQCGTRNYSVPKGAHDPAKRLTVKKYCKHCNAHTTHKQTV